MHLLETAHGSYQCYGYQYHKLAAMISQWTVTLGPYVDKSSGHKFTDLTEGSGYAAAYQDLEGNLSQ